MSDADPSPVSPPRPRTGGLAVRSEVIDLLVGFGLLIVAEAFWLGAARFDDVDVTGIGPATFPRGIALLLGVASVVLVARAIAALGTRTPAGINVTGRPGHVVAGMALVILFPVLMTNLGYFVGSALWMPALFVVAGYRKPLGIVLLTAGFLALAKVAFEMILGVRLP